MRISGFFSWFSQRSQYFQHICRRPKRKHCGRWEKRGKPRNPHYIARKRSTRKEVRPFFLGDIRTSEFSLSFSCPKDITTFGGGKGARTSCADFHEISSAEMMFRFLSNRHHNFPKHSFASDAASERPSSGTLDSRLSRGATEPSQPDLPFWPDTLRTPSCPDMIWIRFGPDSNPKSHFSSPRPCFFWHINKKMKTTKNKDFSPYRTPKSLEKKGKTPQTKNKDFLAGDKKKGTPQKKERKDKGGWNQVKIRSKSPKDPLLY